MRNLKSIYLYTINLPNGAKTITSHEGIASLSSDLVLKNVLLIPELKCNLISTAQLACENYCFISLCVIQNHILMRPIEVGEQKNGLLFYKPLRLSSLYTCFTSGSDSTKLWHNLLGHPSRFSGE